MTKEKTGMLQMLSCAALWSMAGVMFKYIPWHPLVIAALRAAIAGIVVYCFLRARKLRPVFSRRTLWTGVSKGLTCVLFVVANKLTTAANAIVLQYTAPVFLLIFAVVFLRRRFAREDVAAVILTLAGITLFFFDRLGAGQVLGNFAAVAAGMSMGLMYLLMGEAEEDERLSSVLVGEIFTVAVGLPVLLTAPTAFTPLSVTLIVILGVFQMGIPYILYALAAGKCSALACCLLGALEPLLNPIWVLLFYGEKPGTFALLGGAVVILTVTLWSIWSRRGKSDLPKEV
ncbi:MAG: EamA family transporter [Oscillospiraceae bacterium]|nr:EamA family transporter [Oscillospiraceae bacterium]